MRISVVAMLALALGGCGGDAAAPGSDVPVTSGVAPDQALVESLQRVFSAAGETLPPLRQISAQRADFVGFRVRSEDAVATWERLRALTERTGFYPLLFRDEHGMLAGDAGQPVTAPAKILEAASALSGEKWLEERAQQESLDSESAPPRGAPSVDVQPQTKFVLPFDVLSGKAVEDLWLLLIPTVHGYEVPAYMGFGGWNDCPNPEAHVAVLRHWHERYGAELVTMGGDILELRARPTAPSDALALALEQYHYCTDIVTQGVGTVDALAQGLRKSTVWYFWWD